MKFVLAVSLLVATPHIALRQKPAPPTLREVMSRAAQYAVDYGAALSTVVAREDFSQEVHWANRSDLDQRRQTVAEIAFLRLDGSTDWLTFRNVVSVDGRPVQDGDLLQQLFQHSPDALLKQARTITATSAIHNLGPISREISLPTSAVHFVHPQHQERCRFDKSGEEVIENELTWIVRFQEREGGLISRYDGRSLRAEGRLWIVPADGRLLRSELIVKNYLRAPGSRAQIDVSWKHNDSMNLWLPSEMRERYEGKAPQSGRDVGFVISGVATYSNYRRFETGVKIR